MGAVRERMAGYWDEHVARWLAGDDLLDEGLSLWYASYEGRGDGVVDREGMVEPYTGDLRGLVTTPRVVILGLNPGRYYPQFQSRGGVFADEIREQGSYSRWMTTGPYLRPPWTTTIGPNRYQRARLAFTRRWLDDPAATHHDMLIFEAYPWHSTLINARLRPPATVIDEFVWQPIAELPTETVFAFGRPWDDVARTLDLRLVDRLGRGGRPYGSCVPDRAVRVYALPSGQHLVVEWHKGSAGPPSAAEVVVLKAALAELSG